MSWNKPSSVPQPPPKKSAPPSLKRGLLAGLLVVALGALGLYLFSGGEADSRPLQKKERGRIKEVTPAAAPTNRVAVAVKKIHYWEQPTTNGLSEVQMRKWWVMHRPAPSWTNTTSLTEPPPAYAIFDHHSENEIAFYLTLEPGVTLVGTPVYGKSFERDFLKSLEEPIIVKETDPDDVKELKRAVSRTKADIKARMDAGEKLGDILLETRKAYQDLATYRQSLEKEVYAVLKEKGDFTQEDVDVALAAANKMLDAKGVAPMKISPAIRYSIMRRARGVRTQSKGN